MRMYCICICIYIYTNIYGIGKSIYTWFTPIDILKHSGDIIISNFTIFLVAILGTTFAQAFENRLKFFSFHAKVPSSLAPNYTRFERH